MSRAWQTAYLWRKQKVACGLRLVTGDEPGVWRRWWRHGVAEVSEGELRWRPGFLGTIFVFPTARERHIQIVSLEVDSLRGGSIRDMRSGLNPETVAFVIHTSTASIQCACFPPAVEGMLRVLGFPLPD